MGKIKTREKVKDIKVFDRAADVSTHMKNTFVKSKDTAEQTQEPGHNSPSEYATDNISGSARNTAEHAAHHLKNPRKKAAENWDKAKQNLQEAKRQLPKERKQAAEQTKKTAEKAQKTADTLKGKADQAQKTAREAQKAVTDAKRALQQTQQAGRQSVQTARQSIKTSRQAEKGIKQSVKTIKQAGKGTVKATQKSVKTAKRTAKVTVKTAKQTAKTAQKSAQAAAKAAKAAAQASKAAAKAAVQTAKAAVKVTIAAIKAIIAATKALISAIAAGGWVAVVIILIIVLIAVLLASPFSIFMGDGAPEGGSSSIGTPIAVDLPESVLRYKPIVERECNANGIPEYVDTILAIMMQESGGNVPDVMQSSESLGLSPNSLQPEESIAQGVKYFKQLLDQGVSASIDFFAILQSYNYGGGYIGFVARNGGVHTQDLADMFSNEQAARLGWSNYGDKLYVPHVMRYLDGVGNVVSTDTPVGRHLNSLYAELSRKIGTEAANLNGADTSEVVYDNGEGDSQYSPVEVLAVYSVKATLAAADEPITLALFEQEQADALTSVFWDMHSIRTEVISRTITVEDEEGNSVQQTQRVKVIHVIIKTAEEMKQAYHFNGEQKEVLDDMLTNPYRSMLMSMLGSDTLGDLTPEQLANLFNNLPEGENGAKIVRLALSRLGHPYSQPLAGQGNYTDCSYLSQWCHKQIGISIPRTAAAQAEYCVNNGLTIRKEDLRPGDLIFFSSSRNGRFMNITHVAIYAGNGMIVDASSSRGEVVYRKLFSGHVLYARAYAR